MSEQPDPSEIKTALAKYLEAERVYNDLLAWAKARKLVYNRDVLPVLYALREEGIVSTIQRDGVVRLRTKREHWTPPYEHATPADAAAAIADSTRTVHEPSPEENGGAGDIIPDKIHDDTQGFAAFDPIPAKVTPQAASTPALAVKTAGSVTQMIDTRIAPNFPEAPAFAPEQPTAEHTPTAKAAKKPAAPVRDLAGDREIPEWVLVTMLDRGAPVFSRDLFQELAFVRGLKPSDVRGGKRLSNRFWKIKRRLRREGMIAASTIAGSPGQLWSLTDAGRIRARSLQAGAVFKPTAGAPATAFAVLRFLSFCFDRSGFIAGDVNVEACAAEIEVSSARGFVAPVVRAGAGLQLRLTDLGSFVVAGFREAHRAVDLLNQHTDLFLKLAEFPGRPL